MYRENQTQIWRWFLILFGFYQVIVDTILILLTSGFNLALILFQSLFLSIPVLLILQKPRYKTAGIIGVIIFTISFFGHIILKNVLMIVLTLIAIVASVMMIRTKKMVEQDIEERSKTARYTISQHRQIENVSSIAETTNKCPSCGEVFHAALDTCPKCHKKMESSEES